jgi:hypothetical protein
MFILFCVVFFSALNDGFKYIEYLSEVERKKEESKKREFNDKALRRACRIHSKFLNSDGSINTIAAREYIKNRERQQRRNVETISFEVTK